MAVNLNPPGRLLPIAGVKLAVAAAGIKYPDRNDMLLISLSDTAQTAAVFTQNKFAAAPVTISRDHLAQSQTKALLVNSGNANCGTGKAGEQVVQQSCTNVAKTMNCEASQVLVCSTGVIGELLAVDKVLAAIPTLAAGLTEDNWTAASQAIMTTDTLPKGVSATVELTAGLVTITGIAKGSGMIRPDMATMLAYIATDALLAKDVLQSLLEAAAVDSFNAITIDGDTSTNDSCMLIASGASGINPLAVAEDHIKFVAALNDIFYQLAEACVRDGEGATKFIKVQTHTAMSADEARDVAYTVAHSPLVKTAFFASDPNWGRILAAVGRAPVSDLDLSSVAIYLDDVCLIDNGQPALDYTEARGQAVMNQSDITVRIELNRGSARAHVLTCDFSYDYVKINAEYRS